jgi:uncharacterized membrane protein SpoIIM required for sporulation/uncharacterized RDD family membrane protein YckC
MRDLRQHLLVETPEHVVLDYEIAGVGSRALAAILDSLVVFGLLVALAITTTVFAPFAGSVALPIYVVANFAVVWGYFALFEGLRNGQTPGKRRMGIRVIRETGHPLTMREALARNLLRIADFMPPPYLLGGLLVAVHPRGKRLGDLVAGTVVVRENPVEVQAPSPDATEDDALVEAIGAPLMPDEDFRVLREFAERANALPGEARTRVAAQIASHFAERFEARERTHAAYLARLYREESARRRSKFAVRAGAGGSRSAGSSAIAERLVALQGKRWQEFQALADRVAQRGLDALSAHEVPDFALRYRETAADLARARTYGADARVLARLERMVATGHNALYRSERSTFAAIGRFLAFECPAAIVQARRYVAIACLSFVVPAIGGYTLLRDRPTLAAELLPDVLLERAEEGRDRSSRYGATEISSRPFVASAIITNNVQVAFSCFAGGIFLGVGSLASLAFNGLLIGATSGHFANAGVLAYLWTFVAGHGVLELFAIWVAGAAGFLLGLAIIAPGSLARRDALVINGRLAVRMISATALLLLVAGIIEGFLSTSALPMAGKVAISAASALALAGYLALGARSLRVREPPSASARSARSTAH